MRTGDLLGAEQGAASLHDADGRVGAHSAEVAETAGLAPLFPAGHVVEAASMGGPIPPHTLEVRGASAGCTGHGACPPAQLAELKLPCAHWLTYPTCPTP